jgi:signal transduction histidine kinase
MMYRSRILVYSGPDSAAPGKSPLSTDDGDIYFFADSPEKLRALLAEDHFEAVIIDPKVTATDGNLFEVLKEAAARNLPVIVTRFDPETDINELARFKGPVPAAQRLILRRNRSEAKSRRRNEADIVSETAATLSHEINNPLMAITANVEVLLRRRNGLRDDVLDKIRLIGKAAERIRTITHGLIGLDSVRFRNTAAGRMIDVGNLPGKNGVDSTGAAKRPAE